jgi:hypothetical protein
VLYERLRLGSISSTTYRWFSECALACSLLELSSATPLLSKISSLLVCWGLAGAVNFVGSCTPSVFVAAGDDVVGYRHGERCTETILLVAMMSLKHRLAHEVRSIFSF